MKYGKSWQLHAHIRTMIEGQSLAYVTSDGVRILELKEIRPHSKEEVPAYVIYDELDALNEDTWALLSSGTTNTKLEVE